MGLLTTLSILAATLCILQVYGYDEVAEYKRALQAFRLMQRELSEPQLRGLDKRDDCKARGDACRTLPKCCGNDHCYWVDGFSLLKDGECVQCVKEDQKCQKNAQCCYGLQCDKGNVGWTDGNCKPPRTSGDCYQDTQCENECNWGWMPLNGECV